MSADGPHDGAVLPVTVLIPTRNRPDLVARSAGAVLSGRTRPSCLVVVDQSDHPDDRLMQIARTEPGVRYVHDVGRGVARARNIALQMATTRIVAMIDDDILVDRDWLAELVEGLDTGRALIRTGEVRAEGSRAEGWAPSVSDLTQDHVFERPVKADILFTGNMATTREAVALVGFFDERFGPGAPMAAAVDNDYGYRALRRGVAIEHVTRASATHLEWRNRRELRSLRWRYGKGQGAFYAKHALSDPRYVLGRLAHQLPSELVALARAAVRERGEFLHHAVYLAGMFAGVTAWFAGARRLQSGPSLPPAHRAGEPVLPTPDRHDGADA